MKKRRPLTKEVEDELVSDAAKRLADAFHDRRFGGGPPPDSYDEDPGFWERLARAALGTEGPKST